MILVSFMYLLYFYHFEGISMLLISWRASGDRSVGIDVVSRLVIIYRFLSFGKNRSLYILLGVTGHVRILHCLTYICTILIQVLCIFLHKWTSKVEEREVICLCVLMVQENCLLIFPL